MIGFIGTATEGSEGGIFKIEVASHDAGMEVGLAIKDGNADGELDVDIASGTSSITTIAGDLSVIMQTLEKLVSEKTLEEVQGLI